ncbi:MAG: M23 family metallopeptidase, partial [Chloroflexota bacterium]
VDRFRCGLFLTIALTLAGGACEQPLAAVTTTSAPVQTTTPTVRPTDPPHTPTPTPPNGPDAARCTERMTVPDIADVIGIAWSPDGHTLAIDHTVTLPSDKITGSPEEFFLDSLDLSTGEIRPLGVGERQQFSGSGKYLSYWSWNGELRIVIGGLVIAAIPTATIPDARWVGDTLYYFAKDELQTWSSGTVMTVAKLPADPVLAYPADDASWSADATRFTITRYSLDGTVRRYLGTTRTGEIQALDAPQAMYTEWSPKGATLLVRYADRIELRDGDAIRTAPLSRFPGPIHQWTPDGRGLLLGPLTPAVTGDITFDTFAPWSDTPAPNAVLPNLLGARGFSPDGRYFSGDSHTGLRTTRLELFRCGTGAPATAIPTSGPAPVTDLRYVRPVVGAITQVLTPRHTGIDIAAPLGSLIVAADAGVVTAVDWVAVGGRRVCVGDASGVVSCAYHTSAALVRVGDRVARGQPVALVGLTGVTTGPHVHWEAMVGTRILDPLTR